MSEGIAGAAASVNPPVLRVRTPAALVIEEFLRMQGELAERTTLQRVFGRSPLSDETRPWFWGAVGALEVGRALEQLGAAWTVLHSVPLGDEGRIIDHLVIGPGGVFTINTKNHSGQNVWVSSRAFLVAGHRMPHIRDTELELGLTETLLSRATGADVKVVGILAVVDPETLTVRERPRDIVVLTSGQLSRWLRRRPRSLDAHRVAALATAAEQEATWQQHPSAACDHADQARGFELVRRAVFRARLVRQLWVLAAVLGVTGAGLTILMLRLTAGL